MEKKLRKHNYIEYIANYLVEIASSTLTCVPRRVFNPSNLERLTERHFPKHIPLRNDKLQGIVCRACNFTRSQMASMGHPPQTFLAKQQYIGARNVKHHCALCHVSSFITQLLTFVEYVYCTESLVIHMNEEFTEI